MPNVGDSDASSPAGPRDPDWLPPEINTGVAHPARVYDYWLGHSALVQPLSFDRNTC
jgi:hypothetical protein